MTTSEMLTDAKTFLTPETWGKGNGSPWSNPPEGRSCAGMAIARKFYLETDAAYGRAVRLFAEVTCGCPALSAVPAWNDAPERTLADVHTAFDAAIAIAQQQEADAGLKEIPVEVLA